MSRRALATLLSLGALLVLAGSASAAPGLLVGIADDTLGDDPARAAPALHELGVDAVRLTFSWAPGKTALSGDDEAKLGRAIAAAPHIRIFVSAYSRTDTPLTEAAQSDYCAFLASFPARFPQVGHVVVWNEPNKSTFWRPQFDGGASAAPAAYASLLARCYDAVKAVAPRAIVIGGALSSTGNDNPSATSNISHSPGAFVRKLGEAYRASGRTRPLFDWFGLHAYGESSLEPPWKLHAGSSTIATGDLNTLLQALHDGFAGTGQPLAARGPQGVRPLIGIMENGYQTRPASNQSVYVGTETVPVLARPASAEAELTQSSQLVDAIRIAYCHPSVGAYFNFLLADEPELGRWQSGVLYADWTKKPSFAALARIVADVHAGRVDCGGLPSSAVGAFVPKREVEVRRIAWPKARTFNWKNDLWRFRLQPAEEVDYEAVLVRRGSAKPVLTVSGRLKKLFYSFVTFPRKRLAPGRYEMRVTLSSVASPALRSTLRGPVLTVLPRPGRPPA